MKHTLSFMVWAILAVLLPLQMAQAAAPPTELQKRLQNFPDISDIKPMQSDAYPEKYVFFINQLLGNKNSILFRYCRVIFYLCVT